MNLAWLQDDHGYSGGAELSSAMYQSKAPAGVSLIIRNDREPIPVDVDGYILGNCANFTPNLIPLLAQKPTIKIVHDVWPNGNSILREWLLNKAQRIILVSPLLKDWLPYPINAPTSYCPTAVDISAYEAAARLSQQRHGTIWLGRMWLGKGLENVIQWSKDTGTPVDYYGSGRGQSLVKDWFKGQLSQAEIPDVLARYDNFIFLPDEPDPCPRSVIEAWAAGCNLLLNGMVGSTWWLQNDVDALYHAADRFWQIVLEVMQ